MKASAKCPSRNNISNSRTPLADARGSERIFRATTGKERLPAQTTPHLSERRQAGTLTSTKGSGMASEPSESSKSRSISPVAKLPEPDTTLQVDAATGLVSILIVRV